VALQYGVPLRDLVNKFAHVRFEPSGFTGNQEIPIAKSSVDYIFRWLGSRFLGPDDKAMLGLIDRSALVGDSPSESAPSPASPTASTPALSPALASAASASAPGPEEGPSAVDEAINSGGSAVGTSSPTAGPARSDDPPTDAPKATAVAAEPPPTSSKATAEVLAVLANGQNGHGTNGGGKAAPVSLGLGSPNVAFKIQEDAPSCAECGSIMIRNGSCYKCLNCGSTSGCS
jgi:ribonucleoside-diphosphate reductase alpha chain